MKFIDLWEDQYLRMRSPLVERLSDVPSMKLMEVCERYKELRVQKDRLMDEYEFICSLVENNEPEKDTYSRNEMEALKKYLSIVKDIDDYERMEIYKLGCHDCMTWLEMIDKL